MLESCHTDGFGFVSDWLENSKFVVIGDSGVCRGKRATGAKRGKTFNGCQARETCNPCQVQENVEVKW